MVLRELHHTEKSAVELGTSRCTTEYFSVVRTLQDSSKNKAQWSEGIAWVT